VIRITIDIDHSDGEIRIVRDDSYISSLPPVERVERLVAAAQASAIAAMRAKPERAAR
jgi:hypothetical protein